MGYEMTRRKKPKISLPHEEDAPSPQPDILEEVEEAKKRTHGKRRGRGANILAGRLTSQYGKKKLGE